MRYFSFLILLSCFFFPLNAEEEMKLIVAPQSLHSREVTLFWSGEKNFLAAEDFEILQNGKVVSSTKKNFCVVKNLTPESSYSFSVKSKTHTSNSLDCKTLAEEKVISIKNFGAVGDGKTLNTQAIQAAIDACPKNGIVQIPQGKFVTGALHLKSDMTLEIQKEGVLQGSKNADDYLPMIRNRFEGWELDTYASLLNAGKLDRNGKCEVKNISLRGEGKISGGGEALAKQMIAKKGVRGRGRLLCFLNVENVEVAGLRVEESPCWTLHYIYSKNFTFRNLDIHSRVRNGDGIDPDSSVNSYILDCDFDTGDDCIAIKSGKNPEGNQVNRATENVWIHDCRFARGHGLSIGSEMSGSVRNVFISDCVAGNLLNGLQIKATKERGGVVENIQTNRCDLQKITILTNIKYNNDGEAAPTQPLFRNFQFTNIDLSKAANKDAVIQVMGFPAEGHRTKDILFSDIKLPAKAKISVNQSENITFSQVITTDQQKPDYQVTQSENVKWE